MESKDEKMEDAPVEETKEKKIEVTDDDEKTPSLPLEPFTGFAPVKLDKISPHIVAIEGAIVAPKDRQIEPKDLETQGMDVSSDIDIQEVGFLSLLNMLPDEEARNEFLRWAKVESLRQGAEKKKKGQEKISHASRKLEIPGASRHNSTLRQDVKAHTRTGVSTRPAVTRIKYEKASRRTKF